MTPEDTFTVGKIPSGLFIVIASDENHTDGFLGSFVQQVSMDPLRIALAIKPGRPAYDLIKAGNLFSVNVVGTHDKSYMKHFWSGYNPDDQPWDKFDNHRSESGAAIVSGALGAMECKMHTTVNAGDHELIIADVVICHTLAEDGKPMVHIRPHGLKY